MSKFLDRVLGYGGMLGGAVASEIPYGYALLGESVGFLPEGYGKRVQAQFMPIPNETVQSDLQAAAPYIEKAELLMLDGADNGEAITGMPREMLLAVPQAAAELAGYGLLGKGLLKGVNGVADELSMTRPMRSGQNGGSKKKKKY